ncbi:MAG: glycine--tRNA ligase subunit beta [Myxococcota bacterium]
MTRRFLLEILCEEIPVVEQEFFLTEAPALMNKLFGDLRIEHSPFEFETTPRRLVVTATKMALRQNDLEEEISGPPLSIAYKDGKPTRAATGFCRKFGVEIDQLHEIEKKGKKYVALNKFEEGKPSLQVIPQVLNKFVSSLSFRKSMRWGDKKYTFTRPIKGFCALLGDKTLKFESHGVESDRVITGHRFLSPKIVYLENSEDYEAVLRKKNVMVDTAKRKILIKKEMDNLAQSHEIELIEDSELFDEVALLVEEPTVCLGSFDSTYLEVPDEVILSAMRKHQRYFAFTKEGKLAPRFATVLGTRINDPQKAREGNEKVLSARLSDARFFFREDKKRKLDSHRSHLEKMVYHKKLGSLWDKVERIIKLAEYFSSLTGSSAKLANRAAFLCKMDLDTLMVQEFPDLQGIMGSYYARAQSEDDEIAQAIKEHYFPRFATDSLPVSGTGICLSLADRLDTIAGGIAAGLKPTGSRDPFALRRSALGFWKIVLAEKIELSLDAIIRKGADNLPLKVSATEIKDFMLDRLRTIFNELAPREMVKAVLSVQNNEIYDAKIRIDALLELSESTDFQKLVQLFKRVNILKKAEHIPESVNPELLEEDVEKNLYDKLVEVENKIDKLLKKKEYSQILNTFIPLWKYVDIFFDDRKGVRVLCDNRKLRDNRVAIVAFLDNLFGKVADFKLLAGLK